MTSLVEYDEEKKRLWIFSSRPDAFQTYQSSKLRILGSALKSIVILNPEEPKYPSVIVAPHDIEEFLNPTPAPTKMSLEEIVNAKVLDLVVVNEQTGRFLFRVSSTNQLGFWSKTLNGEKPDAAADSLFRSCFPSEIEMPSTVEETFGFSTPKGPHTVVIHILANESQSNLESRWVGLDKFHKFRFDPTVQYVFENDPRIKQIVSEIVKATETAGL